jgi:hypothetical protein
LPWAYGLIETSSFTSFFHVYVNCEVKTQITTATTVTACSSKSQGRAIAMFIE